MKLFVRPEAEADLSASFRWYEERSPGLGREFLQIVDRAFARISSRPRQFLVVHRQIRRALTRRFPYAVFFIIEDDAVVILAVLHQASDPSRWKSRDA